MEYDIVRDTAVTVLLKVFEKDAYPGIAIDHALRRRDISERGRRFLTQLVYGTVRHKTLCDHVLVPLLNQPMNKLPAPILTILRMGVFQALFCGNVTFPAMVHTSVDLARHRGHAGVARLANAVLRRAPQTLDAVKLPSREKDFARFLVIRHSMPEWLIGDWIAQFGEEGAEALCETVNMEAPITLRANTLKMTPEALLKELTEKKYLVAHQTPVPEEITVLSGPAPAHSKLFQRGLFMVQDPASMLPAHLVDPQPGERILDLCAAPGGKTTHMAQLAGGKASIVCTDIHANRLGLVLDNVERLEVPGILPVCGDGALPAFRVQFDRVLVDAPCSGLGTLRRHPDLKWRVSRSSLKDLARTQEDLLRSGIRVCKNGGLIVYSVCTFTPDETSDVVNAIIHAGDVEPEDGPEWLDPWKIGRGQYRIIPTKEGLDGFFLTRLRKRS